MEGIPILRDYLSLSIVIQTKYACSLLKQGCDPLNFLTVEGIFIYIIWIDMGEGQILFHGKPCKS